MFRLTFLPVLFLLLAFGAHAQGTMSIEGLDGPQSEAMPISTMTEGIERMTMREAVESGRSRPYTKMIPVEVSRLVDANTPALRSAMAEGKIFPSVTLGFNGYELELTKARLSSASSKVDSGSAWETLVFISEAITWRYGDGKQADESSFDFYSRE